MDYYGADLTDVIMTALNLTSQVYEKSNLKQSISISLLSMFQLPLSPSDFEDAPGVAGGKDAQKMLTKFCEFMGTTDLKYDAAIYWTRWEPVFSRIIIVFKFLLFFSKRRNKFKL